MSAQTFDDKHLYQLMLSYEGGVYPIGGGSEEVAAVHTWEYNTSDPLQQWQIYTVDTATDYKYYLESVEHTLYLDTYCKKSNSTECNEGHNTLTQLSASANRNDLPEGARWKFDPTGDNDGTYYLYNQANGTDAWLDIIEHYICLNSNSSDGFGGKWIIPSIALVDQGSDGQVTTSALPSTTTFATESSLPSTGTSARPATSDSASSPPTGEDSSPSRLSTGAKAGIAVAAVAAAIVVAAALAFLFWRRRKSHSRLPQSDSPPPTYPSSNRHEKHELHEHATPAAQRRPQEADGSAVNQQSELDHQQKQRQRQFAPVEMPAEPGRG